MLGTPYCQKATKAMLLGCGELGKEVCIELQRFGVEVIAVDRYANAPAMQVAHRSHVINMLDGDAIEKLVEQEKPDYIIPEIEAIATTKLVELEKRGFKVFQAALRLLPPWTVKASEPLLPKSSVSLHQSMCLPKLLKNSRQASPGSAFPA